MNLLYSIDSNMDDTILQFIREKGITIDYEYLAETAEAMVQLAFVQIMLNKFIQ